MIAGLLLPQLAAAQPCNTPQGDQVSYGTNDTWLGYVYDEGNFVNYMGYVTEGVPGNASFSQDFGGSYVNFPTNGCSFYSEGFSIRYKLIKTFPPGSYTLTISGDDQVRLSLDGGATWLIDLWTFNGFLPASVTLTLSGTYNMILEYQEGAHQNRVFFNVETTCAGTFSGEAYGIGTTWNAYYYKGVNFDLYKGSAVQSTGTNLSFTQNFGGDAVSFPTSDCPVYTDFFSARYRLRHTFPFNSYTFTVSGDDKYRLSLDGGATWVIDRWNFSTGNTMRMYTSNLSGSYDIVLEYYEKDGSNFIQLSTNNNILLPLNFISFMGKVNGNNVLLDWNIADQDSPLDFVIERSADGQVFQVAGAISQAFSSGGKYSYTDIKPDARAVYYRIRMVDQLNKISYSPTVRIAVSAREGIRFYPTIITNRTVNLETDRNLFGASISVCDISGNVLARKQIGQLFAGQTISFRFDNIMLAPGLYLIQLADEGKVIKTERVLVR